MIAVAAEVVETEGAVELVRIVAAEVVEEDN